MTRAHRQSLGFSLIELMVSLVAGLIVSGAVIAFTMSSLRANSEYVQATRLTQELRNTIDFVSRELRRAGYDENSMGYYSQPPVVVPPSPFSALRIENPTTDPDAPDPDACVLYAYDRQPGDPGVVGLAGGEIRGLRRVERTVNGRQVGVLEVAESSVGVTPACDGATPNYGSYPAACNAASGWCPLSDPGLIDITSFVVDISQSEEVPSSGSASAMRIRYFKVDIRGSLIGIPDVVRGVQSSIRIRADCLRPTLADLDECNDAPVGS